MLSRVFTPQLMRIISECVVGKREMLLLNTFTRSDEIPLSRVHDDIGLVC